MRHRASARFATFPVIALLASLGGCIITGPPPAGDAGESSSGETADDEDENQESSGRGESSLGEETSDSDAGEVTSGTGSTTTDSTTSTTTGSSTTGTTTGFDTTSTGTGTTTSTTDDAETSDTDAYAIPGTFATMQEVVRYKCSGGGCHDAEHPPIMGPDVNPDVHGTMLSHTIAKCGDIRLIDPGSPETSGLVQLLKGPCGDVPRMPFNCGPGASDDCFVPPDYIDAIERWIAAGAPPTE